MSSVGYGDFSPKTDAAKLVVMSQHLVMIGELAKVLKIF
jgi:phage antirepressor YoqD-like protein